MVILFLIRNMHFWQNYGQIEQWSNSNNHNTKTEAFEPDALIETAMNPNSKGIHILILMSGSSRLMHVATRSKVMKNNGEIQHMHYNALYSPGSGRYGISGEPKTRGEQSEDIPVHTPSAPGFGAVVMVIIVPEWVGMAGGRP